MKAPALPISEAAYQARILDYAHLLKLRVFHSGDSRRDSCAGYPDLTIVGPFGVLFLEVKTANGRIRPEQAEWLEALNTAGMSASVVRPGDWSVVKPQLERIAGKS